MLAAYHEADRRGLVTLPTMIMPVSVEGYLEAPLSALDGPPTGTQSGNVRVGPLKLVYDGAPACAMCLGWGQTTGVLFRTFAMAIGRGTLEPIRTSLSVAPRLGKKLRTGLMLYRPDEARAMVKAALDRGFAIATHAIGNEAVALALESYAHAGAALHRAGIARIEHAEFVDPELVARAAGLGVAAVLQPHFVTLPAFDSAPSIPGMRSTPQRWLLDAGVTVAGSSDFPVAGFDPLDGIRSAVSRRTRGGRVHEPDQRVSLDEALAMYTRDAARVSSFPEAGTLEPGKSADLVVLDRALSEQSLAEARVRVTIVRGDVRWGELG